MRYVSMDVIDVEAIPYHFPIDEAWDEKPSWYRDWQFALTGWEGSVDYREECIVKVHTDEGITGIGGAIDEPFRDARVVATVIEQLIEPVLVGEDPTDIERLWDKMWQACGRYVAGAKGIGHGAISAINVACWDILGQSVGAPIYKLLGGDEDAPVKPYIGTMTLGWRQLDDIDSIVEEARHYVNQGYEAIKVRGGRGLPQRGDIETLEALRNEFPPEELEIMVDINGGYDRQQALEMARKFEQYDIFWMEDPFDTRDFDKYAKLQEEVNVNIFTGAGPSTMELSDMIDSGATTNLVSISVEHSGGISEAMKVAALINSWDLKAAGIAHEPVGSLATFHVWKAVPQRITDGSYVEYDPLNSCWNQLLTDPPTFEDGELILSDKPGLGTDVNDGFLENHPMPEEPVPQPF